MNLVKATVAVIYGEQRYEYDRRFCFGYTAGRNASAKQMLSFFSRNIITIL